jgi:sterol desaturase/sphingolipid hydroxylase (fatty acid hydroxylase superfamily)
MAESREATGETPWILRLSESKVNYWATYVVDLSLMTYFVSWDALRLNVGGVAALGLFAAGLASWTLSEYVFHRWLYHLGFPIARSGHEKHHHDPTAYIALPWMVTPLLFLPPQFLAAWFEVPYFSSFLGGWFGGFIAYSFLHHSLHHYKSRFAWFRHLQSEHRIHHALPETNFGVTMRFWDRVFGTEFTKEK